MSLLRSLLFSTPLMAAATVVMWTCSLIASVFDPHGNSQHRTARIWDITTLGQVFALKGHTRSVLSASFSPNGKQIVTSSDDQTARIWSIGTNIFPSIVTATSYPIESSAISGDGRKFVIGTFDGRVIAYDIVAGSELRNSARPPIKCRRSRFVARRFGGRWTPFPH